MSLKSIDDLTEEEELIRDMFVQACYNFDRNEFSHHCISTYEQAQDYLIRNKIISPEKCRFN